ncbi:hypothetical protein AB1Y20_002259 [Prymnesium parvum]|uniref:Fe2OG dioxygenase domain-containing protein n=1 Tax=Prymnesium parvum TaxID=97485 RepID=A0AB34JAM1_PRYPA
MLPHPAPAVSQAFTRFLRAGISRAVGGGASGSGAACWGISFTGPRDAANKPEELAAAVPSTRDGTLLPPPIDKYTDLVPASQRFHRHLKQYRRRRRLARHHLSTRSLERSAGVCARCASELYLDAAEATMRCSHCETAGALRGDEGTTALDADGSIVDFLPHEFADGEWLALLQHEVQWEQHDDRLRDGRLLSQARLISYQAHEEGHVYSYPGISRALRASRFTPSVDALRHRVEERTGLKFNAAHINLYRDGGDHVSWHTDEDVQLYGHDPTIASLSFGATRRFVLRRMSGMPYTQEWQPSPSNEMVEFSLGNGSLLVMRGMTQRHWEHCVGKESVNSAGPRINITFRQVVDMGTE